MSDQGKEKQGEAEDGILSITRERIQDRGRESVKRCVSCTFRILCVLVAMMVLYYTAVFTL